MEKEVIEYRSSLTELTRRVFPYLRKVGLDIVDETHDGYMEKYAIYDKRRKMKWVGEVNRMKTPNLFNVRLDMNFFVFPGSRLERILDKYIAQDKK